MKKLSLKKLLPEQKTMRFLLSTLLLTLGGYFAYPIHGIIATLPLCFVFSVFAYLVSDLLWVHLLTAGGIAFFYGLTTIFYDPFTFALFAVLSALAAAFAVKGAKKVFKEKKLLGLVSVLLSVALGILSPFVFSGTPMAYLEAKQDTAKYLAETYPEQSFEEVTLYYNLREKSYEAQVEYLFEGNDLTSAITFSEPVRDGFLDDFVSWMQEKRKSVLIDVLRKGTEDVVINSAGLSEKTPDGVFHGSYGSIGTEMEPLFHFSATFRDEKPERREFADACRSVMATMKESGFDYGSVTFYALDAGNVIYECTVNPETDPELVLSLVKYAD